MGELKRGLGRERKERGFGGKVTPHLFFSFSGVFGGGGGGVLFHWTKNLDHMLKIY